MARLPDLLEFAGEHGLKIGTIRDLIQHRSETEKLIECVADKHVDCAQGHFRLRAFADRSSGDVHLAMSCGEIKAGEETLVRVHEAVCVLDFLDHGSRGHTYSVDFALRTIAEQGSGVLVLLHRAESGNALLAALKKEKAERPAYTWDPRIYGIGAQILRELGVGKMQLMSSPRKMPSMAGFGLEITGYFSPPGGQTE
jgi:3,4-dihydroxy 2-butanone 4-phosphate synthase/GTP cyclohydrolase II